MTLSDGDSFNNYNHPNIHVFRFSFQYFVYKLRNTTADDDDDDPEHQTHLQTMFESYLAIAAMVPNVLFMFLNTAATKL